MSGVGFQEGIVAPAPKRDRARPQAERGQSSESDAERSPAEPRELCISLKRYRRGGLDAWLAARLARSTSDGGRGGTDA